MKRIGVQLQATVAAMLAGCVADATTPLTAEETSELGVATAALTCNGSEVPEFETCQRNLWPNGIIPYSYDSTLPSGDSHRGTIEAAMQQWETQTGGRIDFRRNDTDPERVVITKSGCNAGIPGKNVAPGTQTLNVGTGCDKIPHELGHIIGLSHEHQRLDRNRFVDVGFDRMQSCAVYYDNGIRCGFQSTGSDFNPYRTDSCMQYDSRPPFTYFFDDTTTPIPFQPSVTRMDGSNARSMYAYEYGWNKFLPLGFDVNSDEPLDNSLAPGVSVAGSPAIASQGPGGLDIYARGSNNRIYHRSYANGAWSGYADLGGSFSQAPVAASFGAGSRLVSAVGGGTVSLKEFAGTWSGWTSVGSPSGTTVCSSAALTTVGTTALWLFVRGCDGKVYSRTRVFGVWLGWMLVAAPPSGVTFVQSPSAAAPNSTDIELFITASNKNLYHTTRNSAGTWSAWTSRGGLAATNASPAVVGRGTRIDIMFKGDDGDMWWFNRVNGTFSPKRVVGGLLNSSPASYNSHSDHIDTLAVLSDGGLWLRWYH